MNQSIQMSGQDSSARIPVLNVAPFLAGEPGAAERLAAEIKQTCEDTGRNTLSTKRSARRLTFSPSMRIGRWRCALVSRTSAICPMADKR